MPPQQRRLGSEIRSKIGKRREIPRDARIYIIAALEAGGRAVEISRELGVPKSTISTIKNHYQVTGQLDPLPRSGRPEALSEADKHAILQIVREQPTIQPSRVKKEAGLSATTRTISAFLKHEETQKELAKGQPEPTETEAIK